MEESSEVLQQQSTNIGASAIVPNSRQLFAIATAVEEYAVEVRKQRRTNTTSTAHSRWESARVDSFQPTNSTPSGSFVSELSPYSEPVAIASPPTSTEELGSTSTQCGKCTGVCVCGKIESHSAVLSRPSSSDDAPPPRPAGFEHPSHRFDRSWQQPERDNTAYRSTISARPASDDDPRKSRQTLEELVKSDPEMKTIVKESRESLAVIEAGGHPDMEPSSSQRPNDGDESDDAEEVDGASEDEAQPSVFQPIAGVRGRVPRNWRIRHERSGSSDDHWHRRL
jgi:hypothetical protein